MTTMQDAPADTRMMSIVHQAIRRDLHRAQLVFSGSPSPRQRAAVARHISWMMRFLRDHHRSEDVGLYPLVRQRAPQAAPLIEAMLADHESVAVAIAEVEAAAASDDGLLGALDRLAAVLLPHLLREEDEMMPVVSSVVTDPEWLAIEQEHNIKPKSFVQLGREGHWLLDEASAADRAKIVGLVPAVPRFVLVHGFGRAYRRGARRRWGRQAPPRRVQPAGTSAVDVEAGIDTVWHIVSDVTRTGDWSHECVSVEWVGAVRTATPGARFRGRNRAGIFRWGRTCEIVSAAPYELVWRTIPTVLFPDSTRWAIRLSPRGSGTHIEQSFTVVRGTKLLSVLYALMIPAHRDRLAALGDDLRRIGDLAAATPFAGRSVEATH